MIFGFFSLTFFPAYGLCLVLFIHSGQFFFRHAPLMDQLLHPGHTLFIGFKKLTLILKICMLFFIHFLQA